MQLLRDYALSFVGRPYRWGGDDPMAGYDCSGFVQELLDSCGIDPAGDQTAQALYNFFSLAGELNKRGCGSLVFYGASKSRISHVAMMLDEHRIIEAGGGDSRTKTEEDAVKQNAYIRVRHFLRRKDLIAVIRPNYSKIGTY